MKIFLVITLVLTSLSIQAGNNDQAKIENYTLGEQELVIFPFGMDQKITVGKVDEAGNLHFDWSSFDISKIKNQDIFLGELSGSFDYYCDETVVDKGSDQGFKTVNAGNVYPWNGTRWLGALTPASSEELKNHLEDEYGKDAVKGSYLKWVYSSEDAQYHASCKIIKGFYGGIEIETHKNFQLDFKQGWNAVLFEVTEVAPVKDAAATTTKTTITTIDSYPTDIIWFFKKF